jgi:hypothetical protein
MPIGIAQRNGCKILYSLAVGLMLSKKQSTETRKWWSCDGTALKDRTSISFLDRVGFGSISRNVQNKKLVSLHIYARWISRVPPDACRMLQEACKAEQKECSSDPSFTKFCELGLLKNRRGKLRSGLILHVRRHEALRPRRFSWAGVERFFSNFFNGPAHFSSSRNGVAGLSRE